MRAMFLEFPEDPIAWTLDQQYMLGNKLLVAPVFDESEVQYYVPKGDWVNIFSGETVSGPGFVAEEHSMMTLPVLLRPDSAIIIGKAGHSVTERIGKEGKGFTLIVSAHTTSEISAEAVTRGGDKIVCQIKPTIESGKAVSIMATVERLSPDIDWEMLVIGSGVGLDTKDPGSQAVLAKDGRCLVQL